MGKNSWKKIFGMVYAGQAFSIVGSAAAQFAVIWWLTAQTGSAVTLTLASIVSLLPNMFLGPFAGVWVDRCNRKWVMIAADGLVALSSVALAVAFWLWQAPSVLFIYGVLFIRGIGNTFHSLAMEAAIPMFVPVDKLTKAGGWGKLISSLSNMLGPALGAGMLEILPVSLIQLFDVAGALVASLCLLPVSLPKAEKKGEKVQLLADLRQGFAAMKENKPLMVIFFPLLVANMLVMPLNSLYPLLVYEHYMGGAAQNALTEIVFSAGMFSASLAMGIWGGKKRRFLLISGSVFVLGMAALGGGLLPQWGFALFLVCAFLIGVTVTFFNILMIAYIQETAAQEVAGKVLSLVTTAAALVTPFGLLLAGPLSERIGVGKMFAGSGALIAVAGILCWLLSGKYDREEEMKKREETEQNRA